MSEIIEEIKCLDHGFVKLVDKMGDDSSIVQAARVSYGKGTKSTSEDKGLIRYLVRNRHTTPLEMVTLKFHCKMPIFVARQWVRHRTASINEYSARYSILDNEYYIPEMEQIQPQSSTNNQGREGELSDEDKLSIQNGIRINSNRSYNIYNSLLGSEKHPGIARELARTVLPVNFYTQWYWQINLHNLFHFLSLRMDEHAQYEIRVYANAMYEIIKQHVPLACKAFEDYVLNSVTFSAIEMEILYDLIDFGDIVERVKDSDIKGCFERVSKREITEFINKISI